MQSSAVTGILSLGCTLESLRELLKTSVCRMHPRQNKPGSLKVGSGTSSFSSFPGNSSMQSRLRIYTICSKIGPWVNFSRKTLTGLTSTPIHIQQGIVWVIIDFCGVVQGYNHSICIVSSKQSSSNNLLKCICALSKSAPS